MSTRATAILVLVLVLSACAAGETTSDAPSPQGLPEGTPPADCVNPPPDITTLVEQRNPLACYGGADVTVDAKVMGLGVVDCPGGLEPAWLSCGALVGLYPLPETSRPSGVIFAARSQDFGEPLYAVFHPDIVALRERAMDVLVTVTGHYDDPAALSCHNTSWPPGMAPPPVEEVVQACRSTFVITALEQLEGEPSDESNPPSEPTSALAPGGIVQAVDTDIVVRSAPGTGADSEIYPDTISPPTLAYVFAGPVPMDGYDWYQVVPADLSYLPSPYELGWIAAASREGDPWIAPAAPECPKPGVLEQIVELSPTARLACFAGEPLTLEGKLGACGTTSASYDGSGGLLVLPWSTGCLFQTLACCQDVVPSAAGITIFADGDLQFPTDSHGQAIRVTGRFDDEAAASCEVSGDTWMDNRLERAGWRPPPGWGEFLCRTEFVVTDIELLPSS